MKVWHNYLPKKTVAAKSSGQWELQFDVIQYRLEHEYGASCTYEPISLHKACWIDSKDPTALTEFMQRRRKDLAQDKDGKLVYLAESPWTLRTVMESHQRSNSDIKRGNNPPS